MDDFAIQIEAQLPRLRRYARVLTGNVSGADDLVQDVLERSWSRRHLWRQGTDLRAWLFTIMHNLYMNRLRQRDTESLDDGFELPTPAVQEQSLEIRDLNRALAQLPTDYRAVLLLIAVEEMQYTEVARVLNLPLGTVMSRLSRARERLRALMSGETTPPLRRIK